MFWILQITASPAQDQSAKKIPGEALNPVGWLEKMFPVLWTLLGPRMELSSKLALKILGKALLPLTLFVLWPAFSFLSFVRFRQMLLFQIPKTTSFEVVAALTLDALLAMAIYMIYILLSCLTDVTCLAKAAFS